MFGVTLKEKNPFEVWANKGNALIGNENMVRKAIDDIFPVIWPYMDVFLHTRNFEENTPPSKFLHDLLTMYSEMHDNWKLVEEDKTYKILNRYEYPLVVDPTVIDCGMFERLDTENSADIYELIITLLNVMESTGAMSFHHEHDHIYGSELGYIEEMTDNPEDNGIDQDVLNVMLNTMEKYKSGDAFKLAERIRNAKYKVYDLQKDLDKIKRRLEGKDYKGKIIDALQDCIIKAKPIIGKSILNYYLTDENGDNNTVPVNDCYCIAFDTSDHMWENHIQQSLNDNFGNSDHPVFEKYIDVSEIGNIDPVPYKFVEYVDSLQTLLLVIWNEKKGTIKAITD